MLLVAPFSITSPHGTNLNPIQYWRRASTRRQWNSLQAKSQMRISFYQCMYSDVHNTPSNNIRGGFGSQQILLGKSEHIQGLD